MDSFLGCVESSTSPPETVVSKHQAALLEKSYPSPDQCEHIRRFVDEMDRDDRNASRKKLVPCARRNLDNAYSQMRNFDLDPTKAAKAESSNKASADAA